MIMNKNWLVFAHLDSWWKEWSNQNPLKKKKKVKSCLLVATRRSVRQELKQQATFLFVQLFHNKINPPLRGLYCSLPPASSPQPDHQKEKNLFSRRPRITRLYSGNGTLELERIYMNI